MRLPSDQLVRCVLSGPVSLLLIAKQLVEGLGTCPVKERVEPHIGARARREILAVRFAKGSHQGVSAFAANFAVVIPAAIIESGIAMFLHSCRPFWESRLEEWSLPNSRLQFTIHTRCVQL